MKFTHYMILMAFCMISALDLIGQSGNPELDSFLEKKMKKWKRKYKENLVNEKNPAWDDLYDYL